jgi:FkbM family methyltransferase
MIHSTSHIARQVLLSAAAWYVRNMPPHPGDWRIAQLSAALAPELLHRRRPVTFRLKDGIRLTTDGTSQTGRIAYATGVYEPAVAALIRQRLRPGDTFVDVGANIGYFSLVAARAVGATGEVLAFEPSPEVRRALADNLRLNGITNVVVKEEALGPSHGEVTFFTGPARDTGLGSLRRMDEGSTIRVSQIPFDEVAAGVDRITMVKIDVEGGESGVLEGMIRTLAARHPDIIVEVTDAFLRPLGSSARELLALLRSHGYRVWRLDDTGALAAIESQADLEQCPSQFNAFCSANMAATDTEGRVATDVGA